MVNRNYAMIRRWFILGWVMIVIGMNCDAEVTTTGSYARYQSIVAKSPFRKFDSHMPAVTQSSVGNLTLTGFYFETNVKKVWLKDTKSGKTHYVGEGDTVPDTDVHVDKIDSESQTVVLSHGLESETIAFPANSPAPAKAAVMAGVPGASYAAAVPQPVHRIPFRRVIDPPIPATAVPNAGPGSTPQAIPAYAVSLRRRIMRQNVKPVAESSDQSVTTDPNNGETGQSTEDAPSQ